MRRVYLDHNASTPLAAEAWEAMRAVYEGGGGNASSIHAQGQAAKAALEAARESVAEWLGARPAEIAFTSGGTEADNLAIFGVAGEREAANAASGGGEAPRPHLVTSAIEHHAVLHACAELERRGWSATYVGVDEQGRVRPEEVIAALRPETALVSIMAANNETGVAQPVAEIGAHPAMIAARRSGQGSGHVSGLRFHVDAVQAAGKLPLAVRELGCDLLSVSAHKIYGPQGAGALWIRRGTRLRPMLYGGHHERERRAGTENVAALAGFGAAARLARREGAAEGERLAALRDRFESAVLRRVPLARVVGSGGAGRAGAGAPRVPNTSNICFPHLEGEALVIALDLEGYCVSTGAACSSGALEPSHVLLAMGLPPAEARSCLRFSFGRGTTAEDLDALVPALAAAVARLRAISPGYAEVASRAAAPAPAGARA